LKQPLFEEYSEQEYIFDTERDLVSTVESEKPED